MSRRRAITYVFTASILAIGALALIILNLPNELLPRRDIFADFSEFRAQKEKLPCIGEEASLIFAGDIMLSRDVDKKMAANNYDYPWSKVGTLIRSADIAFGNLEGPITPGRDIATSEMVFRADPENAEALARAGFDILSLANNHTMNFGESGMQDTLDYLWDAGVMASGAGQSAVAYAPVYIERNNIKFAFLSYASEKFMPGSYRAGENEIGVAVMDIEKIRVAMNEAKENADIVIVSMHAGEEYADLPNDEQKEFARAAIDVGADLVIGHHPHVVQPVEKYRGKYIFYSLGNFVFDQMWSSETRAGLAVKTVFRREGLNRVEIIPVIIEDFSVPRICNSGECEEIASRLDIDFRDKELYFWDEGFVKKTFGIIENDSANIRQCGKTRAADLDGDGVTEIFKLEDGVLAVENDFGLAWQSDDSWWIDDFAIADSNNDGEPEVNMSVWRPGNYGPIMPRWVEENDMSIKNHFFVFHFNNGEMTPLWQSSNLDAPNCSFKIFDIDEDGANELVVIEGDYADGVECVGEYAAVWEWKEWGFYNDWRGERGVLFLK